MGKDESLTYLNKTLMDIERQIDQLVYQRKQVLLQIKELKSEEELNEYQTV